MPTPRARLTADAAETLVAGLLHEMTRRWRHGERPLPEDSPRRRFGFTALGHFQVRTPCEDVQRVGVDEPSIVVADIDHHALPRLILRVEIEMQAV